MSEKPEWFKLTEGEENPEIATVNTGKRFAMLALFTLPLMLVGGAMVFANGDEGDDRPNIDTTITSTVSTASTVANSEAPKHNANAVKISTPTAAVVNATEIATPNANKGAGVPAPSANRGDDDGEHEGLSDGREHRDGGEREHHDRNQEGRNGTAPTIPQSGASTKKN